MASRSLGTLTLDLIANTGGFSSGMDQAGRIADRRGREIERQMRARAAAIDKAFQTVAAGIATAFAAIKLTQTIKETADLADSLSKLSQRTGDTVENLSRLQYAASLNDATNEQLSAGLAKLAKAMGDVQAGAGESKAAFDALGLTQDIQNGKFKTAGELLTAIAEKFKGYSDGANKAALAQKIFGESGAQLIPLLNNGADGLKAMGDEAERLGVVIDTDLATASAQFNDNLTRLNALSDSLKITIGNGLIPTLNRLSGEFLLGIKYSDGFFDALVKYGLSNPFEEMSTKLAVLRNEFEQIDFRLSNGRGREGDEARLKDLEQEIGYYSELQRLRDGSGAPTLPTTTVTAPTLSGNKGTPKAKRDTSDPLADFLDPIMERVKAYEDAIGRLTDIQKGARLSVADLTDSQRAYFDVLNSPDWQGFTETQREQIEAYFQQTDAIEATYASQERLNALLAATPTAQLEAQRETMQFLADAFEQGRVSAEQYSEAVNTALGNTAPAVEGLQKQFIDLTTVANDGARLMAKGFTDFVTGSKQDFRSLVSDFLLGIAEMIVQALALYAIQTALGIATGGASLAVGAAASAAKKNAKGGVYDSSSLSAYSGTVVDRPTFFKFANGGAPDRLGLMGEAGKEAILPLERGSDGKLGVKANVDNHAPAPVMNTKIINVLDPAIVGDYLATDSGEQMIMNIVQRNRGSI